MLMLRVFHPRQPSSCDDSYADRFLKLKRSSTHGYAKDYTRKDSLNFKLVEKFSAFTTLSQLPGKVFRCLHLRSVISPANALALQWPHRISELVLVVAKQPDSRRSGDAESVKNVGREGLNGGKSSKKSGGSKFKVAFEPEQRLGTSFDEKLIDSKRSRTKRLGRVESGRKKVSSEKNNEIRTPDRNKNDSSNRAEETQRNTDSTGPFTSYQRDKSKESHDYVTNIESQTKHRAGDELPLTFSDSQGSGKLGEGQDDKELDRVVDVDVEAVSWRERHIKASVCVASSDRILWDVLTDYERLPEFIPNLVRSEVISRPQPGRVLLLQQGVQSSVYWHIEARVVLDLEELFYASGGKELRFCMVDGDFKRYEGRWFLRPGPRSGTTMLFYEVTVIPKLFFPAPFVERIIKADLPVNLSALALRAETDPSEWPSVDVLPKLVVKPRPSPLRAFLNKLSSPSIVARFPVESVKAALQFPFSVGGVKVDALQKTLLNSREDELNLWGTRQPRWNNTSTSSRVERPCAVDEVHLRRLDDLLENGGVHRRVVAAITVQSHIKDVWSVLTDYECLSEFIPNLASSKVISRENNRVRLLQEGCKCILYMVLHARVVLDLWEKPENEILFQQVEGDFDSFQGKWTLEALGPQHTLLKYVVDTKVHKHCFLAEAIVEEAIYEDLPANLCAIRDRVEDLKSMICSPEASAKGTQEVEPCSGHHSGSRPGDGRKRFRVVGLQKDIKVLKRELLAFIKEYGKEGMMPMRSELRHHKRVDLEKAISRMGGFSIVASKLNLCQQRRPRGYWDDFQNVRKEIMLLQQDCGMDPDYLPTRKALNSAGRPDVARALEKWGGANEVARLLGLKVRRVRHRSPPEDNVPSAADVATAEVVCPKPFKISLPEKPRKWVGIRPHDFE